jgi:hypothetical protein
MSESQATLDLLRHLSSRPGHDEVKADFRQLLIEGFGIELGALEFERRVPEVRGRLDALIGRTVFEAKGDLVREWRDVERRMPDYLADREREEGEHFIGVASDGREWAVFELQSGALVTVKRTKLDPDRAGEFLAWLDGALALKSSLPPDSLTIRAELGQDSVAFHLVDTQLRSLWAKLRSDPAVALKRQLWAELLKLVYGREAESDALWFQHTFLVIVAKCIALAVMRLPEDEPAKLLSGEAFTAAGITGAVESDFFDWVVADAEGEALMRRIMNHVRRFQLGEVESDVLKILYESLIDRDERHGLGEYYTPDWLAAKVVRHAVTSPLKQRVLDPACGSGTFLFHAIRTFIEAAEAADMPAARIAAEACTHVAGTDIHPVAVIIARVTCLLALAPALVNRSGALSIPVDLGDALQLSTPSVRAGEEPAIRVPPARDRSAGRAWAHVVIGNPPWVALRHTSADLQKRFKDLAISERVYVGGRVATQSDLCALFAVRAAALYLRSGGRLALVLPLAVLTRGQFQGLRSGDFTSVRIAWDEAWTLDETVFPLFPVPSCVVFGRRGATAQSLPETVRAYSGVLPFRDAPEAVADARLAVIEGVAAPRVAQSKGGSPYRAAFRNGATLFPRMFVFVDRKTAGRLGADLSAPLVASHPNGRAKKPWQPDRPIEHRVEIEFLRPVLLGESIAPHRVFRPFEGVVPVTDQGAVLDAKAAADSGFDGLYGWMHKAETYWDENKKSKKMTLIERFDYYKLLSAQFPGHEIRVVYAKAGSRPAACVIRDERFVVENALYWCPVSTEAEAGYLAAILNSETARARAEQFQSRGQFGARHFDKVVFNLPIPRFDAKNPRHRALGAAAAEAERGAAEVELSEDVKFQRARTLVRQALTRAGTLQRIDDLVAQLLDGG